MVGKSFPTFTKSLCQSKEPDLYLKVKQPCMENVALAFFGVSASVM